MNKSPDANPELPDDYAARDFYRNAGQAEHYATDRFAGARSSTHRRDLMALDRALSGLEGMKCVLDMPAGAGRISRPLSAVDIEVTAADVSLQMLQEASARDSAAFYVQADATALPFADESFDAVVSMRFIYHLPEREQRVTALCEMARVSRRYVAVSFFDRHTLQGLRAMAKKSLGAKKTHTRVLQTRREIISEAADAGLKILAVVPTLRGVSEHSVILFEKTTAQEQELRRRRQMRLDGLSASTNSASSRWARLGAHSFLVVALMAVAVSMVFWGELEDDAVVWGGGTALLAAGLLLRLRLLKGYAWRFLDEGAAQTGFALLPGRYVAAWLLIVSGLAVMSELVWVVPLVLLFSILARRHLVQAACGEIVATLKYFSQAAGFNVPDRHPLKSVLSTDRAMLLAVAFGCILMVLKEVYFDGLFG